MVAARRGGRPWLTPRRRRPDRRPARGPRPPRGSSRYEGSLLNRLRPPAARPRARRRRVGLGRRRPPLPRPRRRHRGQRARATTTPRSSRPSPSRPASSCTCRTSTPRSRRSSSPSGSCRSPARPTGSAVFFCNSGTEALEAAIKLARRTGRTGIVAAEGAFHGRTTGALALTHKPAYREPFEPLLPGVTPRPVGRRRRPARGRHRPRPRRSSSSRSRARRACDPAARHTCGRPARSPARSARCSSSTRCRPASAAPARGSRSSRPASCPTR